MLTLSLVIAGIGLGLLYGLGGMAFNVIFSTTRVFDLSIGATVLISAYGYYILTVHYSLSASISAILSLAAATAAGLLFYLIVYRTIAKKSGGGFFAYFVASLGVLTIVSNIFAIGFGNTRVFSGSSALTDHVSFGSALSFPKGDIVIVLIVIGAWLLFELLLKRTDIGVRFRALAEDRELVTVLGVQSSRYWILAFVIGSFFVGINGILMFQMLGIAPTDGLVIGTLAIAAMLVGGMGSYRGSLLGGVILGVVESLSVRWLSGAWQETVAFALLLFVMMIRPQGILGRSRQ